MKKRNKQLQLLIFVTLAASPLEGCAEDEQEAMLASAQESEVPQESTARDGSARQRRPTEKELTALRHETALECLSGHSLAVEELDRSPDRKVRYEIFWSNDSFLLVEKTGSQVTDVCEYLSVNPGDVSLLLTKCESLKDPNRIECIVTQRDDRELYDALKQGYFEREVSR
jgi:hypothetical protein